MPEPIEEPKRTTEVPPRPPTPILSSPDILGKDTEQQKQNEEQQNNLQDNIEEQKEEQPQEATLLQQDIHNENYERNYKNPFDEITNEDIKPNIILEYKTTLSNYLQAYFDTVNEIIKIYENYKENIISGYIEDLVYYFMGQHQRLFTDENSIWNHFLKNDSNITRALKTKDILKGILTKNTKFIDSDITFGDLLNKVSQLTTFLNTLATQYKTPLLPEVIIDNHIGNDIKKIYFLLKNPANQYGYNGVDNIEELTNILERDNDVKRLLNNGEITKQGDDYIYKNEVLSKPQLYKAIMKKNINEILTRSRSSMTDLQKRNKETIKATERRENKRKEMFIKINKGTKHSETTKDKIIKSNGIMVNPGLKINPLLFRANIK